MTDTAAFEPPVIEHSDWDATGERLLLATITRTVREGVGDEAPEVESRDITMPNRPHPGLALGFLRVARIHGGEIAMSWLLEEAIGADAYDALASEPGLDNDTLAAIVRKVRRTVLGGLNDPKGS